VLDLCAAPGGKATAIAGAADHEGPFVVAADLSVHRSGLVSANIERLGATAAAITVIGPSTTMLDSARGGGRGSKKSGCTMSACVHKRKKMHAPGM
jgi:16S rRNA C967 or C1407 C5-methylase (RsmB/RsmF family)